LKEHNEHVDADDETCVCGHEHDHEHEGHDHDETCECGHEHENEDINLGREMAFIIPALLLMVGGLIRTYLFHQSDHDIISYTIFLPAYLLAGWPILTTAVRNVVKGRVTDEYFLMMVATVAAIATAQLPESVGVMLFFRIGEFFQNLSLRNSRRSIRALMEVRPDYANLVTPDGSLNTVRPQEVKVSETILVKPGEKVPLDGEVIYGDSMLDTSPLTGESVPRSIHLGDEVMAGCVNGQGLLRVKVTREFGKSSVSKILELVENAAGKKARTEQFISRFARYYTPIVVGSSVLVAVIGSLATGDISAWIYRAAVLLVISCPCALVISIPLGYFGGIGGASRRGILIKGAQYLDILAKVKIVVFDKTGTLTKGVFKVVEVVPSNGYKRDELLHLAHQAEVHSNHPIAQSLISACACGTTPSNVCNYETIAGSGVKVHTDDSTIVACNDALLHENEIPHEVCEVGGTGVHLVVNDRYAGHIVISDEIREDAPEAVSRLRQVGVRKVIMLTGDCDEVASRVAAKLGLDDYRANMLPEDKVNAITEIEKDRAPGEKIAAVGDGINDAPLLARADVGVAMGGLGSDAALESADVVIMNDQPSKLAEAISVGRKTRSVVWQNIGIAMGVKGVFIVLGIIGIATLWEAVFADVGVALLAIANATRVLR